MRSLELNQMETLSGGGIIEGVCIGIGGGSILYALGAATNWWNPVGWVSIAFIVADIACLGYGASQLQ